MARLFPFSFRSYPRINPTSQVALIAAVLLAGCNRPDDRICSGLAIRLPVGVPAEGNRDQITAACVERWAARLSFSGDSASDVADAAIGACDDAIAYSEKEAAQKQGRQPDISQAEAYWRREALFRAIQWRAGNCPIEKAA